MELGATEEESHRLNCWSVEAFGSCGRDGYAAHHGEVEGDLVNHTVHLTAAHGWKTALTLREHAKAAVSLWAAD